MTCAPLGSHDCSPPTSSDSRGGNRTHCHYQQVDTHDVLLYMKGTPAQPQCGFSSQVVRVLHAQGP